MDNPIIVPFGLKYLEPLSELSYEALGKKRESVTAAPPHSTETSARINPKLDPNS